MKVELCKQTKLSSMLENEIVAGSDAACRMSPLANHECPLRKHSPAIIYTRMSLIKL